MISFSINKRIKGGLYLIKRNLLKSYLAIGIMFLFVISMILPNVIGRTSDQLKSSDIKIQENLLQKTSGEGLMNSSWPMFHHDVRHTGRSPYGPIDYQPAVKWKFNTDEGGSYSSPAIDENETIYIGADDFHRSFFSIYPNGIEKWQFDAGHWVDSSPALSTDGTIYFGSNNHYLQALWPNGTIKWMFDMGDWVFSSPTICPDGTIYVGSFNHYFYAMNRDGTERWHFVTGNTILSSAAIDDNGIIYFGSHDTYLYALYPNGTLDWRYKTNDRIKGSPSIGDDGTIYVCSWDSYLYAITPNGMLKWKFGTSDGTETSPAIASDGTIYIGSSSGKLFSVTPTGIENWHFQTGNEILSSPAIDKYGTIYCGSLDGNFYALNPDGTLRWKFNTGNSIDSSPAIGGDGTIYIANWAGDFYAFGRGELQADANGPYTGYANVNIQFTGTVYGGILPYTYHWDFGDGHTSNTQNPTHNYTTIGNYTASFTVTDNEGNSSSDTATVTIQYEPPSVIIIKPGYGLYIMDKRIFYVHKTVIIGRITIEADAHEQPFGIDRVEFLIDNKLKATDTTAPYSWTWRTLSFGKHNLMVTAYDNSGSSASSSINILKIF